MLQKSILLKHLPLYNFILKWSNSVAYEIMKNYEYSLSQYYHVAFEIYTKYYKVF